MSFSRQFFKCITLQKIKVIRSRWWLGTLLNVFVLCILETENYLMTQSDSLLILCPDFGTILTLWKYCIMIHR